MFYLFCTFILVQKSVNFEKPLDLCTVTFSKLEEKTTHRRYTGREWAEIVMSLSIKTQLWSVIIQILPNMPALPMFCFSPSDQLIK